jgi:hypothetical protein
MGFVNDKCQFVCRIDRINAIMSALKVFFPVAFRLRWLNQNNNVKHKTIGGKNHVTFIKNKNYCLAKSG